jgi:transposase-like protein
MNRRQWTEEEKMVLVLEMLKGHKPISQLCKEYGVKDNLAYRWRDEALKGMKSALGNKRKQHDLSSDAEKDRLLKLIGQQAVVIEFQKKIAQAV